LLFVKNAKKIFVLTFLNSSLFFSHFKKTNVTSKKKSIKQQQHIQSPFKRLQTSNATKALTKPINSTCYQSSKLSFEQQQQEQQLDKEAMFEFSSMAQSPMENDNFLMNWTDVMVNNDDQVASANNTLSLLMNHQPDLNCHYH